LINELSTLKKERIGIIEIERKRIHDELHGSYQIGIDKQTEQVKYFQNEISELKKEHNSAIKIEKERVSDDLHQSYQLAIKQQSAQINYLQTEMKQKEQGLHNLDGIMKYYQSDNATKGAKGENRVQVIIKEYYKNCSVNDTSGTPHSGDLLLTLQNIDLRCLIEVKNKKVITEADINKFIHDISECKNNINCALFISLITDNIPNKGNFYVEIRNNMPVIYIYLFDPSSIKFAIETLSFLNLKFSQTTSTEINNQELNSDTIELIYSEYTTLQQETSRIDCIIKGVEKQLHQLKLSKKNLNNRVEKISGYYSRYISMKPTDAPAVNAVAEAVASVEVNAKYTEEDLEKIKKWINEKKIIPLKDQIRTIINCSTTLIQKRGTKILHTYMKDHLAYIISKSHSEV
jgi:predicted amino acid-binding ACT domain protein